MITQPLKYTSLNNFTEIPFKVMLDVGRWVLKNSQSLSLGCSLLYEVVVFKSKLKGREGSRTEQSEKASDTGLKQPIPQR